MAARLREKFRTGQLDLTDYYQSLFTRLEELNRALNCFVSLTPALAQQVIDRLRLKLATHSTTGSLFGVPVVVKDNICVRDISTTCGSRMLAGFVPPYNATVKDRLLSEDAVIVAKSSLDEFAMGSSSETSALGPVRHPLDQARVPGGSSGGSAVAVAAGVVPLALGSDTGGSVRQPAAFCGVVGLKPTYGAISRYGLIAYASSLDQIGIFGADVESTALLFDVSRGHDPRDSTSQRETHAPAFDLPSDGITGLRIGLPREYFAEGLDPEIRAAVEGAVEALRERGAMISEVSLPRTKYAIAAYYVIADAEASSISRASMEFAMD